MMTPETKDLWKTILRHLFGIVKALEVWITKQ